MGPLYGPLGPLGGFWGTFRGGNPKRVFGMSVSIPGLRARRFGDHVDGINP